MSKLEAAQAASVQYSLDSVLVEKELAVVDRLVAAFRGHQYDLLVGLAAQISAIREIQSQLDNNTRRAIQKVGEQNV